MGDSCAIMQQSEEPVDGPSVQERMAGLSVCLRVQLRSGSGCLDQPK